MIEVIVTGHICSKKNLLKMTSAGHGYYDKEVRESLNDITNQIARQWCKTSEDGYRVPRPPVIHPAISVCFYVTTERSDNDNRYTTLLDCMVAAGILKDDNVANCNGPVLICSSVKTASTAGAKIFIEESGDLDRLYRYVKSRNFDDYQWLKDAKVDHQKRKAKAVRKL